MSRLMLFLTASLAWAVTAGSQTTPDTMRARQGVLFAVGGGPQPDALVKRFVELAGGSGARIVVMAMASESGATSGEEKAVQFREMGAKATNLWFDRSHADSDSIVGTIRSATAVWFGGGDQTRLARALRGSRAETELIRAWRDRGVMMGGTSAGAAILSTPMITGDERRRGGSRYPRDSSDVFLTVEAGNVVVDAGLGLAPVIVDQHFIRRKRHNRLISLVIERVPHIAAGIDESTALVMHPDGVWTVEGESVVIVYDARNARRLVSGNRLGASGVQMHVLPPGSRFDPRSGVLELGR